MADNAGYVVGLGGGNMTFRQAGPAKRGLPRSSGDPCWRWSWVGKGPIQGPKVTNLSR
jgi:hypothetical protein